MPSRLKLELVTFGIFALIGLLALPIAVFFTGVAVFGGYGDGSLGDFLRRYYESLGAGSGAVWFLTAAPYLVWLCLRLVWFAIRSGRKPSDTKPQTAQ